MGSSAVLTYGLYVPRALLPTPQNPARLSAPCGLEGIVGWVSMAEDQNEGDQRGHTENSKDQYCESANGFPAAAGKTKLDTVGWVRTHTLLHLKTAHSLGGAKGIGMK
jgi:hypothetical protein